ncbi:MAG: hypothetical protein E7376_04880 [Clostridiales bacterium]|nr:hypothetical protein [Clostridiales bacterium]
MEEKIINGEQLNSFNLNNAQNINVEEENEKGAACNEKEQSSLGKFKDTNSLLTAYNNLQAEFTRKCQKLSEITKQVEEQNNSENIAQPDAKPIFQNEDWQQKVSAFLNENSGAKKYSGEIATEILNNKNLQSSPHALELAWAKVMQNNFVEPDTLASDQNFINEKILSRDDVKKQVINEYFKNLQNLKTPPIISGQGTIAYVTETPPKNMAEAKQRVEKLFNLKG